MAGRVSDYRIRRIADRGNEEDAPDSRARGDRFYHNRRSADRGNEKVDRDPGNISENKGLRRRLQQDSPTKEAETESNVWDDGSEDVNPFGRGNHRFHGDEEEEYPFVNKYLNFQEETIMLVEEESCPFYDTNNEEEELMPAYDTNIEEVIEEEDGHEKEVVYDDYEEASLFDDDQYEAETENISAQQDIQEELPTDEILDKPIETPHLKKLDVNDDPVDALNINKLDDSHVVEFDASSAGLSRTKILPVAVEVSVVAKSDVMVVVDKLVFKSIKVRGQIIMTKKNLMHGIQSWMLRVNGISKAKLEDEFF
uniref:Nucleotide-binding alpha-beta plait domain-containing protein n=1 Tax=Tanacetum cinerariifolium TaxID=118510 RepID=A0A699KZP9_TANCI|nr:nucleotide-binding alpha-beta plait domain-containing protein [Tanacetum cinerariifolium]